MKIFLMGMYPSPSVDTLATITKPEFAHFSVHGTWENGDRKCDVCGVSFAQLVEPLVVTWEPSSEVVGDFSWDGPFGYVFVVKERVRDVLVSSGFDCAFLPVMAGPMKRRGKHVANPAEQLLWARCSSLVELDHLESRVTERAPCTHCGRARHTFKKDGIVIDKRSFAGELMFRIRTNGASLATFVTEDGRRILEKASLGNLSFTEGGVIT